MYKWDKPFNKFDNFEFAMSQAYWGTRTLFITRRHYWFLRCLQVGTRTHYRKARMNVLHSNNICLFKAIHWMVHLVSITPMSDSWIIDTLILFPLHFIDKYDPGTALHDNFRGNFMKQSTEIEMSPLNNILWGIFISPEHFWRIHPFQLQPAVDHRSIKNPPNQIISILMSQPLLLIISGKCAGSFDALKVWKLDVFLSGILTVSNISLIHTSSPTMTNFKWQWQWQWQWKDIYCQSCTKKISESYKYTIQLKIQQLSISTMQSQLWQWGLK